MQTINIRTTQNVTIEYELASLRDRAFACVLDMLALFFFYLMMIFFWNIFIGYTGSSDNSGQVFFYLINPIAILSGYHFFMEVFANGQSLGKKSLGIKVVRLDGNETQLGDHLLRAVFYFLDVFLSIGTVAAISVSASSNRQRLGDLAANTTVIRLKSQVLFKLEDILKIDSIEHYEPTYPQVRQLSEEDMLLIKNIIGRYRDHQNFAHEQAVLKLCKRLSEILDIQVPANKIEFLKTLIKDYIVLTR